MASKKKKILVVDDEAVIRRILATRLTMVGYDVAIAADGREALDAFQKEAPDLVVLDVMMPHIDGLAVCQELRQSTDVPIIMLTALGDVSDRIRGLQFGADDYITKPFSPKELEARIGAIFRRLEKNDGDGDPAILQDAGIIQVSNLRLEVNKRQVYIHDRRIRLTGMEFDLLYLLVSRAGDSIPRGEILQEVWGYNPRHHADMRVVDVHVSRLRSKIETDPRNPEYIHTDRGIGYFFPRFSDPSEAIGA